MATVTRTATATTAVPTPAKRRLSVDRVLSPVLLSPSFLVIAVFVYGFIGYSLWVSMSNWRSPTKDLSLASPVWRTYKTLFQMSRFQIDLRNIFVFTVIFLFLSVILG